MGDFRELEQLTVHRTGILRDTGWKVKGRQKNREVVRQQPKRALCRY
jgi:hypothetical protein